MSDIEDFSPTVSPGLQMGFFQMRGPDIELLYRPAGAAYGYNYLGTNEAADAAIKQQFQVPGDRTRLRVRMCGAASPFGRRWGATEYDRARAVTVTNVLVQNHPWLGDIYELPAAQIASYRPLHDFNFPYSRWGAAPYVEFILSVTPGEILDIYVGHGRGFNASGGTSGVGYPDGGSQGIYSIIQPPSAMPGGGSTSLRREGASFRDSLIVLPGGGGKRDTGVGVSAGVYGFGGTWGGGGAGIDQSESLILGAQGLPATPSAAGLGSAGSVTAVPPNRSSAGDDRNGGWGNVTGAFGNPGGGGGGGWYGGGGGASSGGGGGSGFISPELEVIERIDGVWGDNIGGLVAFYL